MNSDPKRVQRVAAKAVILAEGGILALHPSEIDANRNWHIPGGIRDDINEPIQQTAVREVLEETGIDLANTQAEVIKVGEWSAVDKNEDVQILAVFFLFRLPARPEIVLSEEHVNSAWLDAKNHDDFQANKEVHEIVQSLGL